MWNEEIKEFEVHLEEGLYWMEEGDYEQALESFQRAIEFNPDCSEIYHYMGYIFSEEENFSEALDAYLAALRVAKQNLAELESVGPWWADVNTHPYLKALKEIGVIHYKMENYEDAISCFCQLLNLNPQDSLSISGWLIEAYLITDQFQSVLDFYELFEKTCQEELKKKPSRPKKKPEEKQYEKTFQKYWKDNQEAQEEFLEYLHHEEAEDPLPPKMGGVACYNFGLACLMDSQEERARQKLKKALELNPYVFYELFDEEAPSPSSKEPEKWMAEEYVNRFGHFWLSHSGAMALLKKLWKER